MVGDTAARSDGLALASAAAADEERGGNSDENTADLGTGGPYGSPSSSLFSSSNLDDAASSRLAKAVIGFGTTAGLRVDGARSDRGAILSPEVAGESASMKALMRLGATDGRGVDEKEPAETGVVDGRLEWIDLESGA